MKPTGFIKNPTIVKLLNGPDHENWIEVGEKEKRGLVAIKVSYAPQFGWLYWRGWITPQELEKAKQGKKFEMLILYRGHMVP